ncbi:MAG: UDP-N-acetylmuramoyl-tripeptide--D-alanyl-D-alanine ligase [Planctomycetales bacterium]|nr:UDP-N-acetylmuramoyl-tripeptide--D-alanyl-D-alanine ligase [Planctomycetales bacterium]
MNPIRLQQLIENVQGQPLNADADMSEKVTGVSIDSRTVEPGQAFFAIRGENFDGHEYAVSAIEKGAACVVVERPVALPPKYDTPVIGVDNTIAALGRLATWYRSQLGATVIAITGSVGKTTTRNLLCQVLSRFYKCRQAQKSFNNHIGVPLTILSAQMDDDILLLELGSNHPGEIAVLTRMVCPDVAVITLVSPAHLEGFGTLDAILKEKASIAWGVKSKGMLYINGDQPQLVEYIKKTYARRVTTFGTSPNCDVIGADLRTEGSAGWLSIEGRRISVPLAGRANLMNVLTVWSICRDLKITLSDFAEAIQSIKPIAMRLQMHAIGRLTVLDDCYNANPVSMANALSCLHSIGIRSGGRTVFAAGCMGELGEQSKQLHQELGANAVAEGVQVILAAGLFAQDILSGAKQAGLPEDRMQAFENTGQLCDNLHKWLRPDDIILVKGSRSAGMEKAIIRLRELVEKQEESAVFEAEVQQRK